MLVRAPGADRSGRPRLSVLAGITLAGRPGDIDGIGILRLALVSFPVYFQCKRYAGSVGAGEVRNFRGAIAGRTERGLLITTGRFTGDAIREATRDGVSPIDLIDGERLCELMAEYGLGVRVTERTVRDYEVLEDFFIEF